MRHDRPSQNNPNFTNYIWSLWRAEYEASIVLLRMDQIRPLEFVTKRLRLRSYNPNLNSNQNIEEKNATQHNEKAIKSSYIANLIPIKRLPFTATANFQHTKHEKKTLCEACTEMIL